jgi:hypothetical protein
MAWPATAQPYSLRKDCALLPDNRLAKLKPTADFIFLNATGWILACLTGMTCIADFGWNI